MKAYIQERLNEDISIAEIASTTCLSESYFFRQFREATGQSPHQYLIRCRVERAKVLMQEGKLTIAEIARRVGFADQSHLAQHFRRAFGVSP